MSSKKYFGNFNDYGYNCAPAIGPLDLMKQSTMNVFLQRFKSAEEMSIEGFCNIHDARKIFKNRYDLLTIDSLFEIYHCFSGISLRPLILPSILSKIDNSILIKTLSLDGGSWDGYKAESIPLEKLVNTFIFQRSIVENVTVAEISRELLGILKSSDPKLLDYSQAQLSTSSNI